MNKPRPRAQREPTIALINIVFLMLVFFMVAGTLAQPLDKDLKLVNTQSLDGIAPPDALVIHADGVMAYRGTALDSAAAFLADMPEEDRAVIRLVPDRNLPATTLVNLTRDLRLAGAGRVLLVTEKALK
ncbi:MAG: biopolymer transporter ExbD [Sulfitobacter sp.]